MAIQGLRILLQVVELGSVKRAARELGVPRTTVRRKLESLEAELGSRLLAPGVDGVVLTAAGERVVNEGRRVLEGYSRMVQAAKLATQPAHGIVRVLVPVGMPDEPHFALLGMLQAAAPGVGIDLYEVADPRKHLHEPFDLLFYFGAPLDEGQWFSRTIMRLNLMPLASEAYLQQYGRPSSLEDLANHRLLGWRVGELNPQRWPLRTGGVLQVNPVLCSSNGQLMHHAAERGLGIVLGYPPPAFVAPSDPLVPVLEAEVGCEVCFRCLSPSPTDLSPRVRAVVQGILDFLSAVSPAPK